MKLISFFSRVAIVCNVAFVIFAFLSYYQKTEPAGTGKDSVQVISWFKNTVIILGVSAIVINLILCLVYAIMIVAGRQRLLPKNLVILNFLFFLFQLYFYFFRNH